VFDATFEDSHEELNFFTFCLWRGSYRFYEQGVWNMLWELKKKYIETIFHQHHSS